jgi:uncharacterized protein with PQ loop repeat
MISTYGWIASSITIIYKLPQIYKLYKRKTSEDISFFSLFIQAIGYVFYIIHGLTIKDNHIIIMGSGALIQNTILIILYFIYSERCNNSNNSNNNDIEKDKS